MTIKPKLQRFQTATAFACPICQEALDLIQQSLVCTNRHSFDLAKFGYVNLAPQVKASKDYDKENFQNRQLVLENGFTTISSLACQNVCLHWTIQPTF